MFPAFLNGFAKLLFFILYSLTAFAQTSAGQPSCVVERKPLDGVFAPHPLNTVSSLNSYSDSTLAPYETYTYRVRVPLLDPSPEITVGPPPAVA